jgi:hypothetical protein
VVTIAAGNDFGDFIVGFLLKIEGGFMSKTLDRLEIEGAADAMKRVLVLKTVICVRINPMPRCGVGREWSDFRPRMNVYPKRTVALFHRHVVHVASFGFGDDASLAFR